MEDMKSCIFNIQRYSIHDGPGIRTVVFFNRQIFIDNGFKCTF